jgi:D-alanyl-D-alanine endopeptidase (penicillin-binding protein 7)
MRSNNLNNLLFALVVLMAVLFGGIKEESKEERTFESRTEATSVLANPKIASSVHTIVLPTNISAVAALVKKLSLAEPLFSLNENYQWPIASITKLMTAVVASENIPPDAKIKFSAMAIAAEGDAGNFLVDGVYELSEVLGALLKASSNDAGVALAEHYDINHKQREPITNDTNEGWFVEAMNRKAKQLKTKNTRFFDPTGLSPLNQSALEDLEKLVIYIYQNHPEIFSTTREKEGNTHPFAGWPDFIGGKTGFIDEANGNLISLFNHEGQPLLIIVLGSEDRYSDTLQLYNRFTQ